MAVLDGLQFSNSKSISSLWLELDSLLPVNMLQGICDVPWNIIYIFIEIKTLLPPHIHISHIYREANQCANFMANWEVEMQSDMCFEDSSLLPRRLQGKLKLERVGLPYIQIK